MIEPETQTKTKPERKPQRPKPGNYLVDRLRVAGTSGEVESLLARGEQLTEASPKIRAKWHRVAEKRIGELQKTKT